MASRFPAACRGVLLALAVCVVLTGLGARAASAAPDPRASRPGVIAPSASHESAIGAAVSRNETVASPRRTGAPKKNVCRKLRRRRSLEPGQSPSDLADSRKVDLRALAIADPDPAASFAPGVALRDLPPRAPPASPSAF